MIKINDDDNDDKGINNDGNSLVYGIYDSVYKSLGLNLKYTF